MSGCTHPGCTYERSDLLALAQRLLRLRAERLLQEAVGRHARLRALLVAGRVVAEHDAIPGLDLAELRHDAQALVQQMLNS